MKKIFLIKILFLSALFLTVIAGAEDDNTRFTAAKAGLVLRETPDTSGKKITLIPENEEVTLIEEKGDTLTIAGKSGKWSKITWNDKTGWAFGGFLKTREQFADESIPLSDRVIGKTFGFQLFDDEQGDEFVISIENDSFSGYCYNGGMGKSDFTGTLKVSQKGNTVTYTLKGSLEGFSAGETYEKISKKISNGKFTVTRKDGKLFGTNEVPGCYTFKERELVEK